MDRRIRTRQPEIVNSRVHRLTCSGQGVDRDQAVEGYIADGRRSIQLLGLTVPGHPVDRKAHRPDFPDQPAGTRIELHKGTRFSARTARIMLLHAPVVP